MEATSRYICDVRLGCDLAPLSAFVLRNTENFYVFFSHLAMGIGPFLNGQFMPQAMSISRHQLSIVIDLRLYH